MRDIFSIGQELAEASREVYKRPRRDAHFRLFDLEDEMMAAVERFDSLESIPRAVMELGGPVDALAEKLGNFAANMGIPFSWEIDKSSGGGVTMTAIEELFELSAMAASVQRGFNRQADQADPEPETPLGEQFSTPAADDDQAADRGTTAERNAAAEDVADMEAGERKTHRPDEPDEPDEAILRDGGPTDADQGLADGTGSDSVPAG